MIKTAVLTVSDRASDGTYEDKTGPQVVDALQWQKCEVVATAVVADDFDAIRATMVSWIDNDGIELVITNGGTGIGPRDVTPEATRSAVDIEVPGFGELMRLRSYDTTPMAALSRATAGRRGTSLIVNLPGSTGGARECLQAIQAVLPHAIDQLAGGKH